MIRPGKFSSITFSILLLAGVPALRAATNSTPAFKEVFESLRAHLAGVDEAQLNQAAVAGLLNELGPRASLVTTGATPGPNTVTQLVSRLAALDGDLAYLRVARVGDGLAAEVRAAYQALMGSNKLSGVVLDLRFAEGTDYAAAVATTELFALKKTAALDWGKGPQETRTGNELVSVPLVVLINGQTRVAAETLAALLREGGAGLLLGNPTAGQAVLSQDFLLSNGATLRIATASVKLNGVELSAVRPDLAVAVSGLDERAFFADALEVSPGPDLPALTNRLAGVNPAGRRVRLTEASLVRAHKQGLNPEEDEAGRVNLPPENKPEVPVVKDPVLARALDLLRGLAIVRPARP